MAALLAPTFSWSFKRSCSVKDKGYRAALHVDVQREADRKVEGQKEVSMSLEWDSVWHDGIGTIGS